MPELDLQQGDFFYALRNLIQILGSDNELTMLGGKQLAIKPKPSLGFPVRDIDCIDYEERRISIICQFMGLYGVDSPLPVYFNHNSLGDGESRQVMRDFLDIFTHRNYVLYFLAWQAFFPEISKENNDFAFFEVIKGFSGRLVNNHTLSLANCIGHSNAASLYTLIHHLLPNITVFIHESIPQWIDIEHDARVGTSKCAVLGDNSLLGEQIMDTSQNIEVDLGPMRIKQAEELLPGQPLAHELWSMFQSNFEFAIDFKLNLFIEVETSEQVLGKMECGLGQLTWIGSWQGGYYKITLPGKVLQN